MSSNPFSSVLARFDARMQKSRNRIVAVPAEVQRELGLIRQKNNHLLLVSLRRKSTRQWYHHYVKLTYDNEFSIPADAKDFRQGQELEVKIHRIIADRPGISVKGTGPGLLLKLAEQERPGWREDGSRRIDEYLNRDVNG